MNRFFGKVGYGQTVEVRPGVHKDVITELPYYGNVEQNTLYIRRNDSVNGEMSFQTTISVTADAYALKNFMFIRFIEWSGVLWTVTSVRPERPRLILVLGEVYNGPRETVGP